MFLNKKLIYAFLGAALLLGAAAAAYYAQARPRVELAETLHDFGTVSEDRPLTHTFLIKNRGAGLLRIKDVHADCTCTASHYDRVIPPFGQGSITLTIKPFALKGAFAKKTRVAFNDPGHPQVVFILKGFSQPLIDIQPSQVIRFKGKAGEDLRRQVRLTSNLPEPWEISSFKTNIPQFIEVTLKPEEPGRAYVVEVRQTRQEPGRYRGLIELFNTFPKRPRLVLRVLGEVLPQVSKKP